MAENEIQSSGSPNPNAVLPTETGTTPTGGISPTQTTPTPKANEPNIIFIRKVESKGEMVAAEPPAFIVDGNEKITLPSADEQIKGFYHERAGQIIQACPKMYKRFTAKGSK